MNDEIGEWIKVKKAKTALLTPSDDRPFNDVIPADQLSNFSLLCGVSVNLQGHIHLCLVFFSFYIPPPEPATFDGVTFQ